MTKDSKDDEGFEGFEGVGFNGRHRAVARYAWLVFTKRITSIWNCFGKESR